MNIFVPVNKKIFDQPISEFRMSQEFVSSFKRAVLDNSNFRASRDEIIFTDGQSGIALRFNGNSTIHAPMNIDNPFYCLQIAWASLYLLEENNQIAYKKTLYRSDLNSPENKPKNISIFFQEAREEKAETSPKKMTAFEERWGRPRFKNEPGRDDEQWEGFLVPIFKPTPDDNGLVALGGYLFDPDKYPSLKKTYILDTDSLRDKDERENFESLSYLTRDEAAERMSLFGIEVEKVLTIEKFFNRRLPSEALEVLHNKMNDFNVLVSPHPKGGHPTLMAKASNLADISPRDKKKLYILAERNDDNAYKNFIGQLALKDRPGDVYTAKKTANSRGESIER